MSIGENIRRIREATKIEKVMSKIDLAKKAGVNYVSLCSWEKGKNEPSITSLSLLAKALGVTVDELMKEKEK